MDADDFIAYYLQQPAGGEGRERDTHQCLPSITTGILEDTWASQRKHGCCVPELLRGFVGQLHRFFTFVQQVSHAAVLVGVQSDFLQRQQKKKVTCMSFLYFIRAVVMWCHHTSSLNWLLSHMDLKLLLFSKSVIFIFNWGGGREKVNCVKDAESIQVCQKMVATVYLCQTHTWGSEMRVNTTYKKRLHRSWREKIK